MEVHVICWDNTEYDREATQEEIDEMEEIGKVIYVENGPLTFDFSIKGNL